MSVVQTEQPVLIAPAQFPTTEPAPSFGLRLLPAPQSEPPYDDERPGGRPLPLRPATVSRLRSTRPLRLVPPYEDAPAPTPNSQLPAAQPFAQALVQRLLEVLAGVRPMAQLQRDTSMQVYDDLELALTGRPRPRGVRPDRRSIRSVHVQEQDGTAEVNATVRRDGRYGAIALRIEGVRGQWRCTSLALL